MVNVPKDFQDYDDDDPEIEKRKKRYSYWSHLRQMREEFYEAQGIDRDNTKFMDWVRETYGFEPILNERGITDDYKVVDEKKFIVYILKYGK